jgi:putative FmdB family regulatory protein
MPIYEYHCGGCGERFEELVSASATESPPCPSCGAAGAQRVMSMFATEWEPSNVAWHRLPGKHDLGGDSDTRPSISVPRGISDS